MTDTPNFCRRGRPGIFVFVFGLLGQRVAQRQLMKTLATMFIVGLLLVNLRTEAQTTMSRSSTSSNQAITIASQLSLGMKEEKAIKLLGSHGIKAPLKLGCSHDWTCFFPLDDGSSLSLDFAPVRARADGAWRNGLLRAAYIQKGGSNANIALRPGILPIDEVPANQDWQILGMAIVGAGIIFGAVLVAVGRKSQTA